MVDFDALVLAPTHRTFGECVAYYAAIGTVTQVTGIFNDRYKETKFQDGIEVIDFRTVLNVRQALFPGGEPTQADLFLVRGVLYAVTNVEPDGIGDLRVSLRSATDDEAAKLRLPAP